MSKIVDRDGRQLNDPTPEEIAEACRQIRERNLQLKRAQDHHVPERPPGIRVVKEPPRQLKRL